ncbi:MAG: hypothetical protein AAF249_02025 [Pseudomonadota bacterium]
MGRSNDESDIFGDKYTQHRDDDDNKSGTSRRETGLFGDEKIQHRDQDGQKTGHSENRTDIFGDNYQQHFDDSGEKDGYTEERTDAFGETYSVRYDRDGNKIGESRQQTGLLGDKYVEHTSVDDGEATGWDWVTEKAASIGIILGAIGGLITAFGEAESLVGYLAYIGIGAVAGGFLAAIMAAVLPWMIVLGALALMLNMCMG